MKMPAPRIPTRSHMVLFTHDSLFKHKVSKSKKDYQRKSKHRGRDLE